LSETLGKGAQTEAISKNVEASNLWAFFQAKSIRRTVVQAPPTRQAQPRHRRRRCRQGRLCRSRSTTEQDRGAVSLRAGNRRGSEELAKRAKHAEHERDEATAKSTTTEIASAAFQIGIVLASATIITGMIVLAWVSGSIGGRGHRDHRARPLRAASDCICIERKPHCSSSPAKAGDPVRRSVSARALISLEYWIARSSRAMTARNYRASCTLLRKRAISRSVRDDQPSPLPRRISRIRCLIGWTRAAALARIAKMNS
jgi:hypothetical protein